MSRKRREDCFFGIHFDFHAGEDCTAIGTNTDEEQIQYLLDTVKPDFVQCDSKGHPGITSFETQVGTSAPGFARDNLKIWRDVTARAEVPLFLHYSGVFDMAAIKAHPEWAVVDAEGAARSDFTSTKGGYAGELLVPQLEEVINKYDVDGVWVDGEAWAVVPDYSPAFLRAFTADTGIETVPKTPKDPDYQAYMDYVRESFRQYLRFYTRELHRRHPGFQIASNWAFSSYMPEKVSADVDYLSADYNPIDSYNTARFESRYLATQGKPWDIMGWSFIVSPVENIPSTKSACQIQREAAAPLSLGGGFQVYTQQNRDGSLEKWMLPMLGEVGRFCQERKEKCFRAENVPQIAVFLSTYNYYKIFRRPLFPEKEYIAARGITQALLDNQLSVQLISEHHLREDLMRYPVLVLPELAWLEEETVSMLKCYVAQGGHLVAAGPLAAQYFKDEAGASMEHPFTEAERKVLGNCLSIEELEQMEESLGVTTKRYLKVNGWMTGLHSLSCAVTPLEGTQAVGRLYEGNAAKGASYPAATVRRAGKGSYTCIWVNTGEKYLLAQRFLVRDFWGDLVKEVFKPMVRVTGSHLVDVNISRKGEELLVHLINTSGAHGSEHTYIYDEITPLGNLELAVDLKGCPSRVEAVPAQPVEWDWSEGVLHISVSSLDIYTILSIC